MSDLIYHCKQGYLLTTDSESVAVSFGNAELWKTLVLTAGVSRWGTASYRARFS